MLAGEATESLEGIGRTEATVFQKKTAVLRVCASYDARLHRLRENLGVFLAFLGHYMRHRLVFQKKEAVVDGFVDRFYEFVKTMPVPERRDVPVVLRLRVLLAVFSASYARVCDVHEALVAFLGDGEIDDEDVRETIRVLRANGFYHYPYRRAGTMSLDRIEN